MRRFALTLTAVTVTALALTGCSGQAEAKPTPKPFTATGTISVPINRIATLHQEDDDPTIGEACTPDSGYDDIDEGTQVVILNAKEEKIAIGHLGTGGLANGSGSKRFYDSVCEYPFTVKHVPNSSKIYSVHIGNEARGEQSFTRGELRRGVSLTIG